MANEPTTFSAQLKQALKNYANPYWLGHHSPLATPYFLGAATEESLQAMSPLRRGQLLQAVLWQAAELLWGGPLPDDGTPDQAQSTIRQAVYDEEQNVGKGARYYFLALELRYFCRYFQLSKRNMIWEDILLVSKAQFYKDLTKAEQQLGETLLTQVQPPFSFEQPVLPTAPVGRKVMQRQCLKALAERQMVTIGGVGGIGKTTVGAMIAEQWPTKVVFWYTIRPNLNGRLSHVLFSLAHFLQRWGAAAVWKQLVADQGEIKNMAAALQLIHYDLENLRHVTPLLCFDDVDCLCPIDPEKDTRELAQLREFLESLRGQVAVLVIGQRITLKADTHYVLNSLSISEVQKWLARAQIAYTPNDLKHIYQHTAGNPRLLALSIAACQTSEPFTLALDYWPETAAATLQPTFDYLWQQLNADQQRFLQSLSVFRSPAPADTWQAEQALLNSLIRSQLVQRHLHDRVSLYPIFRETIYQDLSAERREQCHHQAAAVRLAHGGYTSAMYHYLQSGEPETAVWLWAHHHQQEIRRGQAAAALAVLRQISLSRLSQEGRKTLVFLRSHLYQFTGEADKALADLAAIDTWPERIESTIHLLRGNFLDILGHSDAALATYAEGLEVTAHLLNKQAQLHTQRGLVYVRQREMKRAWAEARQARYDAENLQGIVQSGRGHYESARFHYQLALEIAQELEYVAGIAHAHANLANLAGRTGDIEVAAFHSDKAIAYYEQIGYLFQKEQARSNLAAMYIQAKAFAAAVEPSTTTLTFARQIKSPYFIAVSATNLAEAYLGLDDLEMAREFADLALMQEEPQSAPYAWYVLGQVARKQGAQSRAEQCHRQALDLAEQNEDRYMGAYAWQALGEILLAMGQSKEGHQALKKALAWFEELQNQEAVAEIHTLLVQR